MHDAQRTRSHLPGTIVNGLSPHNDEKPRHRSIPAIKTPRVQIRSGIIMTPGCPTALYYHTTFHQHVHQRNQRLIQAQWL